MPVIFKDVKTDGPILIDVRMIDPSRKVDLGWLKWVVLRELDVEEENTTFERRFIWPNDCTLPFEQVVLIHWLSITVLWWLIIELCQLFIESFDGCHI